jgi:prephenate dehydrogenase
VETVVEIFKSFKSNYVHLSYEEHDLVTANTQAVTHAAFLRSVPPSFAGEVVPATKLTVLSSTFICFII